MSNSFIWLNRSLKIVTLIVISTIFFIACAGDQDASTAANDSTVNKGDTTPAGKAAAAGLNKKEPQNMPDSTVTRLALREADANQYRHGLQFITRLPNNIDAAQLESRQYGRWYTIQSLPRPFNSRNRDRLSNNIYGYLIYHDMVIRHPQGPHTVFLQWFGNGANIDSVVVWINPAPVMSDDTAVALISDPPRPKVPPPPPME